MRSKSLLALIKAFSLSSIKLTIYLTLILLSVLSSADCRSFLLIYKRFIFSIIKTGELSVFTTCFIRVVKIANRKILSVNEISITRRFFH